ncbi:hypothetical protein GCM10009801_45030 [Streptomyces albiaxialis]|uniref:Protein kinase domain-containing protein n=1 Tax=Streptomyces albiaxialis TaxID=329523 RepID=A0ABN2W5V8_9ACTN
MQGLTTDDPAWIGGYRLLGRLGEGGMGRVYLARSERGRTAAVKVVQAELARQPDFRRRFAQEVRAARRVGDRWTAPVLDADTEADTPWVATGYVAGPSLTEVVSEQYGPLPVTSLRALALGLAGALRAIHDAGLVHRDLKPSNILVTIEGPRVIDFGIARALDAAVQSAGGLTRTGALVGSPGFMSPEQVRGQRVTPASDVFCLGTVLAYAATGRLPFGTQDSGLHALLFRIAEEEADLDGIAEPWRSLIASCLAKAPEGRPGVEDLRAAVEETEATPGTGLGEAWLPAELLAHLGQRAVRLLDSEDPQRFGPPDQGVPGPSPASPAPLAPSAPSAPPAPSAVGAPSPVPSPAPAPSPAPGPGLTGAAPPAFGAAPPPHWQGPGPGPVPGPHPGPGPVPGPGPGPGSGPGPHGTPPPRFLVGHAESPRGLATALRVLLCCYGVALAFHLFVLFAVEGSLSSELSSTVRGVGDFEEMRLTTVAAEGLALMLEVVTGVLWLCWFRRTRLNAEVFAPGTLREAPGFAVGAWFIPFGNLVLPKRIANDVWRASEGEHPASRGILQAWWIGWLAYLLTYLLSEIKGSWYDTEQAGSASTSLTFGEISDVTGLVATVLTLFYVARLTSLQQARLSNRGPLAARS